MGASNSRNHKVLEDIVSFCKDHDGLSDITHHTFQNRLEIISSILNMLSREIRNIDRDTAELL